MSEHSTSGDSQGNENDEFVKPVSEEEGLKSAESIFKAESNKVEESGLDEDKEFLKYLRFRKRAKELGLDDPSFTTIYQGGIHIKDSNLDNYGNLVGNDQAIDSNANTGGFSGATRDIKLNNQGTIQSIESVFDTCDDIKQRSFMIALAALNGCNYRVVLEASQRLQSILQSQAEGE